MRTESVGRWSATKNAEPMQDPQEICSLIAVTPAHADRYLSRVTRLSGILEEKRLGVVVSEHHLQNYQHQPNF